MEKLQQPLKPHEQALVTEILAEAQQSSQTYATKVAELTASRKGKY